MKKKEKTTFMNLTAVELNKQIAEITRLLEDWSVNRYTKPSRNVREGKFLRKKIAIAKTVLAGKREHV